MPLEAKASALVAGSNPGGAGAAEVHVEVVRAFCIGGRRQEPGAIIAVSPLFAGELIFVGKAKPAAAKAPEAEPPPVASEDAETGKRGGKTHARK